MLHGQALQMLRKLMGASVGSSGTSGPSLSVWGWTVAGPLGQSLQGPCALPASARVAVSLIPLLGGQHGGTCSCEVRRRALTGGQSLSLGRCAWAGVRFPMAGT